MNVKELEHFSILNIAWCVEEIHKEKKRIITASGLKGYCATILHNALKLYCKPYKILHLSRTNSDCSVCNTEGTKFELQRKTNFSIFNRFFIKCFPPKIVETFLLVDPDVPLQQICSGAVYSNVLFGYLFNKQQLVAKIGVPEPFVNITFESSKILSEFLMPDTDLKIEKQESTEIFIEFGYSPEIVIPVRRFLQETLSQTIINHTKGLLSSVDFDPKEALGIGVCGSVARGQARPSSDIDILIIVDKLKPNAENDWYFYLKEYLEPLRRDITVFVRDIAYFTDIKEWETLRLATDVLGIGKEKYFDGLSNICEESNLEKSFILEGKDRKYVYKLLSGVVEAALNYGLKYGPYTFGKTSVWSGVHISEEKQPITFRCLK